MKAIIVGGGIGGLTTALMLRARGIGCELFEQADTIRELGVGINTLPHAIRELAGLGLLQKLDDAAIRTDVLYYLNRHGQEVWTRIARHRCRPRRPAIFNSSRPAAKRDPPRRRGTAGA